MWKRRMLAVLLVLAAARASPPPPPAEAGAQGCGPGNSCSADKLQPSHSEDTTSLLQIATRSPAAPEARSDGLLNFLEWKIVYSDKYCAGGMIEHHSCALPEGACESQEACQSLCAEKDHCHYYLYRHDPSANSKYTCAIFNHCVAVHDFGDGDGGHIYEKPTADEEATTPTAPEPTADEEATTPTPQDGCVFGEKVFVTSHRGKQLEDRKGKVKVHKDKGSYQKWTITDAGQGKVFFTSHRGQQLEDRKGKVGVHKDKGSYQKWTITDAGQGKVFLTSHRGQQLQESWWGFVGVNKDKGSYQKWTVTKQNGQPACQFH